MSKGQKSDIDTIIQKSVHSHQRKSDIDTIIQKSVHSHQQKYSLALSRLWVSCSGQTAS